MLKLHRYRAPGESDGAVLAMGTAVETLSTFDLEEEEAVSEIYEKNKGWIAGREGFVPFFIPGKDAFSDKVLSMSFLRKYIHMAKAAKPQLSDEAIAYIVECYGELRSFDTAKSDRERTMPVTARQMETLIRLSTAHAKARLAKHVEKIDAEKAFHLLHFACFKEKPKERLEIEEQKRRHHSGGAGWNDGIDDDDSQEVRVVSRLRTVCRRYPIQWIRTIRSFDDRPDGEQFLFSFSMTTMISLVYAGIFLGGGGTKISWAF